MAPSPTYIDAAAVKALLDRKEPGVQIIDVRDDDFFEGHIKGATQVPSGQFNDKAKVDKVIEELPPGTTHVVLHCMLSQVRGPKCANRLAERLESEEWKDAADKLQVQILRNGFEGFYDQFADQSPELFEVGTPLK